MAQLSSPGVSVTVIDESFYAPASPGTIPLIFVATEENKSNISSTGIAPGTSKANAGKVYSITSQRDLIETFGVPIFKTDANNNPIHAGEQNEYGLQAAYSYLGVSNRAYIARADVDLGQLSAASAPPVGEPVNGDWWFDVTNTNFGIFEWNAAPATAGGQVFSVKYPLVITDINKLDEENNFAPKSNIGAIGSYAISAYTTEKTLWYKKPKTFSDAGTWVLVGTSEWTASRPSVKGTLLVSGSKSLVGKNFSINNGSITANTVTDLVTNINTSGNANISAALINDKFELYSTGVSLELSGDGWAEVGVSEGTYNALALQLSKHTVIPQWKSSQIPRPTGSIWIKTTSPNLGANWIVKTYNDATNTWVAKSAPLYANNTEAIYGLNSTGGGINLTKDTVYVKYNASELSPNCATFRIYARRTAGTTTVISSALTSTDTMKFKLQESVVGSANLFPTLAEAPVIQVNFAGLTSETAKAELLANAINNAVSTTGREYVNIAANITSNNRVVLTHVLGGEIAITEMTTDQSSEIKFSSVFPVTPTNNLTNNDTETGYIASLWSYLDDFGQGFIPASFDAPSTITADGKVWYDSNVDEVDILINTGTKWVGYLYPGETIINDQGQPEIINRSPYYNELTASRTDPTGPIVMASEPSEQSDGTPLVDGDLWISTADLENYPLIYRYNSNLTKWILLDNSDQTTEEGIIFGDARWTSIGENATDEASSIVDLLSSAYVDFDAPDPVLYPKGMLLWNLRRSGFNVKKFVRNYVDINGYNPRMEGPGDEGEFQSEYYPHRWISIAANQENGAGTFGRKAQRRVVIQALQALVNSNQEIRDEEGLLLNLIACPGYPELIEEMISLNYDRGLTAFVVGDTPARLLPDATSLNNWGNNANGAVENGDDGLVSFDEYMGVFYPWGYTSDNIGNNIVVPPSHMILRMISLSDNVSYPWFAPAGTRRGGITNASAVGYIDSEGEFRTVNLNTGQRDTMQNIKVNPITFISGTGLVNYGQYTRARNASALDRINVARLIVYLRRQLTVLARPYVFEPNDKITRDEFKGAIEGVMLGLVGQRALYDFIVVCDQSNNTPERIDRYELWADVAIEPVKAAEFIYIPLRLKNTGEISGMAR